MDKPKSYWQSNLRITFEQWNAANTIGSLGAVLVVALALFGLIGRGWPEAVGLAVAIGLVVWIPLLFLVITPVRMWNSDQMAIAGLRAELRKERESNTPDFEGTIEQFLVGDMTAKGVVGHPLMCLIQLGILNRGAPSVVRDFAASFTIDGSVRPAHLLHLPNTITWPINQQQAVTIKASDALYEKGAELLERGDQVRGFLQLDVTGLTRDVILQAGNAIEVTFADYRGLPRYLARYVFQSDPTGLGDPFKYYAGAFKPDVKPIEPRKRRK